LTLNGNLPFGGDGHVFLETIIFSSYWFAIISGWGTIHNQTWIC